ASGDDTTETPLTLPLALTLTESLRVPLAAGYLSPQEKILLFTLATPPLTMSLSIDSGRSPPPPPLSFLVSPAGFFLPPFEYFEQHAGGFSESRQPTSSGQLPEGAAGLSSFTSF